MTQGYFSCLKMNIMKVTYIYVPISKLENLLGGIIHDRMNAKCKNNAALYHAKWVLKIPNITLALRNSKRNLLIY